MIVFFIGALIGGILGSKAGAKLAEKSVYGSPKKNGSGESWVEETQREMRRYDQHHDWRRPTHD